MEGALAGAGTSVVAVLQAARVESDRLPILGPHPCQLRRHHSHQRNADLHDPPPKPQENEEPRPKATLPERSSA